MKPLTFNQVAKLHNTTYNVVQKIVKRHNLDNFKSNLYHKPHVLTPNGYGKFAVIWVTRLQNKEQ
jgi:hypothetical protein